LSKLTAGLLVFDKRILVAVSDSTSLRVVMTIMRAQAITSVVVIAADDLKDVKGMVTMLDIVTYVSSISAKDVLERPCSEVFGIREETKNPWIVEYDTSLDKVIDMMSKGIHRVLVRGDSVDGETEYRVLSQSDMLKFLVEFSNHVDSLKLDMTKSVSDLGLVPLSHVVRSVNEESTARQCFQKMFEFNVTALPILNQNSRIIGCISATDLRGLTSLSLDTLDLPVLEFLQKRQRYLKLPVSVKNDTSMKEVCGILMSRKIHRVWVVDDEQRILAVITLSDIIRHFSPYDWLRS